MTPKEKAESLVAVMYDVDFWDDGDEPIMQHHHAVKCALIAVDEIIATLNKEVYPRFQYDDTFEYWENVKQEINNL